jgi:hypothetical protein
MATELFNKYGVNNERGAMGEAREKYDGDEFAKLRSTLEARYSDERRFQAERERNIYDGRKNAVLNAKTLEEALRMAGSEGPLINLAYQRFQATPIPIEEQHLLYEKTILAIDNGEYSGEGAILQLHRDLDGKLDPKTVGKLETQLIGVIKEGNPKGDFKGVPSVINQYKADTGYSDGNKNKVSALASFRIGLDEHLRILEERKGSSLTEQEKYEAGMDFMKLEVDTKYRNTWGGLREPKPGEPVPLYKIYESNPEYIRSAESLLNSLGKVVNSQTLADTVSRIMLEADRTGKTFEYIVSQQMGEK